MTRTWLRRPLLWAAAATALLLAACGGGEIESQLVPARMVVFGDASSDIGQTSTTAAARARYTINDATANIWTLQVATHYGLTLTTAAVGGTSYATGNARVVADPDAAGNTATPTVKEQIDTFLAGGTFAADDLVVVGAGTGDLVAELQAYVTGAQTSAQMLTNVAQAGRDLGAQVRRLVQAGAKQVVVMGPYNLGRSPWAIATSQTSAMELAAGRFNEELLVSIVDLGANVLYVDQALLLNLITAVPSGYGFANGTVAACNSVDPGPGIGTGTGQVNSSLCTSTTLASGATTTNHVFADRVYLGPVAQRLLGDWAFDKIHARW
ncbi:MAG: SGNH/GDSL hydrolase family protein [Burkholderiales bacterium]|nr:SGNH/GDSL hydrolase family protein [Burkholderiales bacterium]